MMGRMAARQWAHAPPGLACSHLPTTTITPTCSPTTHPPTPFPTLFPQVWRFNEQAGAWQADGAPLAAHADWVRDVAWAPALGAPAPTLASAGQDGKVFIWAEGPSGWVPTLLHDFGGPVWRVAWSDAGGVLAVSDARGEVSTWKASVDGQWEQVSA